MYVPSRSSVMAIPGRGYSRVVDVLKGNGRFLSAAVFWL